MTTARDRVKDILIARTIMDEQGLTRRPRRGHCATCHLAVIGAISDSGFSTLVWPYPTTTWGEYQAVKAGLRTYTMTLDELLYRDDFRIRGKNADQADVMIEHQCHHPQPPRKEEAIHIPTPEYDNPPF